MRIERTRRDKKIAVEIIPQRDEERLEKFDIVLSEKRGETIGHPASRVPEILRRDDLSIFKIANKHCLNEQSLRRV